MRPALFYDNMTCDEMGIKLAAKGAGIHLETVNFSTTVNILEEVSQYSPVINRCQSKSRRERASFLVGEQGCDVINTFQVEALCNSKVFTTAKFVKASVNTVKTAYIPFAVEKDENRPIYRTEDIVDVVKKVEELFNYPIVVKPERGSRGRNVIMVKRRNELETVLKGWSRNLDSPAGLLIQECVSKAFDLRIVVASYDGREYECLASLARVPPSKEAFATNTALGAVPVGVELPERHKAEAVKAAKAISKNVSVLGVDAIPEINDDEIENIIKHAENVAVIHNKIRMFKTNFSNSVKLPLEKFLKAREELDKAFREMISTSEYGGLKTVLEDILRSAKLYFIEVNSRPDFYINTRNCTGRDVSEAYVKCVEAML